jgi:hypothetical protein
MSALMPNPSIERTSESLLRKPSGATHVERYATQQNTIQIVPAKQEHARSYRLS